MWKMLLEKSSKSDTIILLQWDGCHGFLDKESSFLQKHTFLHLKRKSCLSDEERFRKSSPPIHQD